MLIGLELLFSGLLYVGLFDGFLLTGLEKLGLLEILKFELTLSLSSQVCLAGFGPREGQTKFTEEEIACFKDVLTADPSYKLVAEFLGQGEGGRWLINIRGKEDHEDIGNLLIDGDLGSARSDQIVKTFEEYFKKAGVKHYDYDFEEF